MNKSALKLEISQIEIEIKAAEADVERIKETYKGEKILLNLYLPSAEHRVNCYKDILNNLNEMLKLLSR